MKRFALLVSVFALLLALVSCGGEDWPTYPASEGLSYTLLENGTYLVEGQNFEGEELIIPFSIGEGVAVSQIGSFAFQGKTQMKKATLSGNITVINAAAFEGCTGLTEIEIPASVERIATMAFEGCASLKSVKIHRLLEMVGADVFKDCPALTEITYNGTAQQWAGAISTSWWSPKWIDHTVTVHCTDGDVLFEVGAND